jgi:hypothetical protein
MARQGTVTVLHGGVRLADTPSFRTLKGGLDDVGGVVAKHGGEIASTAGKVVDVVARVATVIDLIATLGTALRMEQIARNSIARDEELQAEIAQLQGELNQLNALLSSKLDSINSYVQRIDQEVDILPSMSRRLDYLPQIDERTRLLPRIRDLTEPIPDIKQDTSYISRLTQDIHIWADVIPDIVPRVIAQIAPETCKALKNPNCFNLGDFGNNNDLSDVLSKINEVNNKLGNYPFSCSTPRPVGMGYTNVSHALQSITCGLRNTSDSNEEKTLEEQFKDRTDEILKKIDEIETTAAIPLHWQTRIGSNRPQLVVSYAETLSGGKIGRSRYPVSIPHWNEKTEWAMLPKWRKGKIMARAVLSDNSRIIFYASTESEARRVMNQLLYFVKTDYKQDPKIFYGRTEKNPKDIRVEPCTARFFESGQNTEIPTYHQIRKK